jgi:hypothetical protein
MAYLKYNKEKRRFMKNFINRSMLFLLVAMFVALIAVDLAGAEGLLNRNSGRPSGLQQQELDDAYYRDYNDAKAGREAIDYSAGESENNGDVIRGAGRGALGGAAMGKLSDGDAGKGAAWGAGAGAIKGVIKKKRAEEAENTWAAELSNAYNKGYRKGMNESAKVTVSETVEN